jgi:release factor glutamine methyltransferase
MTVYPTVFSPSLYVSSKIFAKHILSMEDLKDKEILDMGTGSGIVSLAASSKGAKCIAVDINPEAVKCADENFHLNQMNAVAIESDLFEKLDESKKFEIIFFNPPYYNYEPRNDFERGFGGGKDYSVIRDFVKQSKEYLKANGYLCLIISNDMNIETMFSILPENGFNYNILQRTHKFFETFYIIKAFF